MILVYNFYILYHCYATLFGDVKNIQDNELTHGARMSTFNFLQPFLKILHNYFPRYPPNSFILEIIFIIRVIMSEVVIVIRGYRNILSHRSKINKAKLQKHTFQSKQHFSQRNRFIYWIIGIVSTLDQWHLF